MAGNVANLRPWPKGVSGNPAGRPKGARSKLEEVFLEDLHKSWRESGPEVIQRVIEKEPSVYLRVVAGLMPKKEIDPDEENLTRDRVRRAIGVIESWIAAKSAEGDGQDAGEPGEAG